MSTKAGTYIRFEYGQQDRIGPDLGPFEYVQATYDEINASPDGETRLAQFVDGLWATPDGQKWSDFVVYALP